MSKLSSADDRGFIARVLSRPDLFPEQFISWLRRFISDNALIHISPAQGGGSGGKASGLQTETDNEFDWFYGAANDASGSPNGNSWQFDTGASSAPFAVTGDGGFTVDTAGSASVEGDSGLTLKGAGGATVEMVGSGLDVGGQEVVNAADPTAPQSLVTKAYGDANYLGGGSGVDSVTDGVTTVSPATALHFTGGATVTDAGGGVADVVVTAGSGPTVFDYVPRSTDLAISATSAATAESWIDGNPVTYDGSTEIEIIVSAELVLGSTDAIIELYRDSTDLGRLIQVSSGVSSQQRSYFDMPTAGSHTYYAKAWMSTGNSSGIDSSFGCPSFIRIVAA